MIGVINNPLEPSLVQRHTQLCLYKTLAWPVLCYGSEAWTTRKQNIDRTAAGDIKFMQRTAGYTTWDHKRNEDILDKAEIIFRIIRGNGRSTWREWM